MGKVLHASYSGYFPFCLIDGLPPETGIGTLYPISLPLKQYMSWWWKVKKWSLSGTSTGNETANELTYYNYWTTTSLNQDINWVDGITSEEKLVCRAYRQIGTASEGFISSIGYNGQSIYSQGTEPQILNFSNNWIIRFFHEDNYIDGQTIYPKIRVEGWFDSVMPGDQKVQDQVDPNSALIIDSIQIPCYTYWYPQWTPFEDWAWTGSQVFYLDPQEYWSYGGTWNTLTGFPA